MSNDNIKRRPQPDKSAGDFALEVDDKQMIPLQEMHCQGCGRFLGYQAIVWGVIKVKCPNSKCKEWNTFDISPES